jgi:hypothetical protein
MSDRIPPFINFYKFFLSVLIIRMMVVDLFPELDAKNPEIRSDTAGLRVLAIELPTLDEPSLDKLAYQYRWLNERHQMSHAFGMEVAAVTLEL